MITLIIPVILCGGVGMRLWPLSNPQTPKQFLKLFGEYSLLQNTMIRAQQICGAPNDHFIIVSGFETQDLLKQQLNELGTGYDAHVLLEPQARNTSAAVAYAALYAQATFGPDAVLWVLPADNHIEDINALAASYRDAVKAAQQQRLVTFGITPTAVETGYGYIRAAAEQVSPGAYTADAFIEKPDYETALDYIDSGEYFWNSGMFIFTCEKVLHEFKVLAPDVVNGLERALKQGLKTPDPKTYATLPFMPFDKAVMEKSAVVAVVPCEMGWSDIGNWDSVWAVQPHDENGNVSNTKNAIWHDSMNCLIHATEDSKEIACVGVENIVVIDTGETLLIADKNNIDALKAMVEMRTQKVKNPEPEKLKQEDAA